MSRTNVDFLFQIAGPASDRHALGAPRGADSRLAFGTHLSQASGSTKHELSGPSTSSDGRPTSALNEPHRAAPESGDNDSDEHRDTTTADASEPTSAADGEPNGPAPDEDHERAEVEQAAAVPAEAVVAQAAVVLNADDELPNTAPAVDTDAAVEESAHSPVATEPEGGALHNKRLEMDSAALASHASSAVPAEEITADTPAAEDGANVATQLPRKPAPSKQRGSADEPSAETQAAIESTAPAEEAATEPETAPLRADELPEPRRSRLTRSASHSVADGASIAAKSAVATAQGLAPQATEVGNGDSASEAAQTKPAAPPSDGLAVASARLQANLNATQRGGAGRSADEAPRVDAARFVGRVAKAFQTAQERGGTLQLRLSPPELGALRLELTVKEGVMIASLETETAAARRVLLDHLPALRDRLAEQNIRVERFDVDVRRDGSGGQHEPATQNQQNRQQEQHSEPRRQPAPQANHGDADSPTQPTALPAQNQLGINLFA